MGAPIGGRSGPVGAHPRNEGALLERWRAQCGTTTSTIQHSAVSYICGGTDGSTYTCYLTIAFLSPEAESASSPHQSTSREGVHARNPIDSTKRVSMAMTPRSGVRELQELIAALDRRVPQVQRAGEASIAREAAALRSRALKRIEELERHLPRDG